MILDDFNLMIEKLKRRKLLGINMASGTILHFAKTTPLVRFAAKSRGEIVANQAGLQGEHHCEYGHWTWKNLGCCDEHLGDEIHQIHLFLKFPFAGCQLAFSM